MQTSKVEKISIALVIVGVLLGILRYFIYINFLGSFLDFLWILVFVILIYEKISKYKYTILALLLGYSFELFQLVCKEIGINTGGYYPGTYDIFDVIAYTLGFIFGIIIIVILNKYDYIEKKSI